MSENKLNKWWRWPRKKTVGFIYTVSAMMFVSLIIYKFKGMNMIWILIADAIIAFPWCMYWAAKDYESMFGKKEQNHDYRNR